MTWLVIILLPKGGAACCGSGLLEPYWKVMESILVERLLAIQFHVCLQGSINKKETGMVKLA